MTEARVEEVHANRTDARTYLEQAKTFQADADADVSSESRSVLLHNAVVSAADAILQAAGLRTSAKRGKKARQLTPRLWPQSSTTPPPAEQSSSRP